MADIDSLNRQIRQEEQRASNASIAADAAMRNATRARHQVKRVETEMSAVQQQLRAVHEEIDRMSEHLKAFEDAEAARQAAAGSQRRLGWLLAMGAGFSGLLAVLGPDTFQQSVVSLLGSLIGGLMVAAGVCCLFSPLRAKWAPEESGALGFMWRFVRGDGLPVGYAIWALVTAVGLVRWHLDCDWRGGACLQELGALAERRFPELLHNLSRGSKKRRSGNPPRRASGGRGVEASRTPSEEIRFNAAGGAGGREARGWLSGDVSLNGGRELRDHQMSREVTSLEPRRDVSMPSGEVSLQGGGREQHPHGAHAA